MFSFFFPRPQTLFSKYPGYLSTNCRSLVDNVGVCRVRVAYFHGAHRGLR